MTKTTEDKIRSFPEILRDLSQGIQAFETPAQFVITLTYCIPALAPIRICVDLGIFKHLEAATNEGRCLSAEQLAQSTAAEGEELDKDELVERRVFIVRLLRLVCAFGLIEETEPFVYAANDITKAMADPELISGFELSYDANMGPKSSMAEMVRYSHLNSFKPPASADDGPYQRARDIIGTGSFHHWVHGESQQMPRLNAFMKRVKRDMPHWTQWYPSSSLFDAQSDSVFMVDVGGGLGHDVQAVAEKHSDPALKMILQEQPSVVDELKKVSSLDPRIEVSVHDFFQAQPVAGAQIYYMHKIMHDWPDKQCVQILTPIREAMSSHSRILLNDMIIPIEKCPVLPAGYDISMWALHSGQERDEEMWERLVAKVGGLKVKKFWYPPGAVGEGIIEIVLA